MPRVTKITAQKRAGRFSIYLDGKFSFGVSESELQEAGLAIGQDISQDYLAELRAKSQDNKFFDRALHYLSFRPRSRAEMATYLGRKGASPDQVDQVCNRLLQAGFLNDEDFATSFARSRQSLAPRSKLHLRAELIKRGLSREIIDATLDEVDEESALADLLARKASKYPDKQKLVAYLQRRGFSYGLISRVLAKGPES